jgi:hypothetical protein
LGQQPTWRGHRAPVEDARSPGVPAAAPAARARRWPALLVGALIAVIVAAVFILMALEEPGESALPDIEVGTCLRSTDLARGESSLMELSTVPCSAEHDAEVFALLSLGAGEDLDASGARCVSFAGVYDLTAAAVQERELEVRPLALDETPSAGDTVACFIRRQDGSPRRGTVFTTTTESAR